MTPNHREPFPFSPLILLRRDLTLQSMPKPQCGTNTSDAACTRLRNHRLRTSLNEVVRIALRTLASTGIFLAVLGYIFVPLLVYIYPDSQASLLDTGIYGAYPTRKHVSTNLTSPQANVLEMNNSCAAGLVLLSIEGNSVGHSAPMILDMYGNLVWTASDPYGEATANTQIQRYRDQDYFLLVAQRLLQDAELSRLRQGCLRVS